MKDQRRGQVFAVSTTIGMGMFVQVRNIIIFLNPNQPTILSVIGVSFCTVRTFNLSK